MAIKKNQNIQNINTVLPSANTTGQTTTNTQSRTYTGQTSYTPSSKVSDYANKVSELEDDYPDEFSISGDTKRYKNLLYDYENNEPDAYESRYDSTIQEILNTIKNRGSFDLSSDANYQQLFNNYKESYTNAARKSMRDTMAQANAATGGYGSTYGQVAAQQAYDSQMEGLNDQNLSLMQMAYNMYSDDRANDYNMLNAYQTQDNTDYSRYRDTYNDWYNNRNYYANRYDTSYNNDYTQYRDTVSDYFTNRDYYANQYQNAYSNDYNEYRDTLSDTDSLYTNAMSYVTNGYDIPSYIKNQLSDEDLAYFNNIKAQAASKNNSGSDESSEQSLTADEYYYGIKTGMLTGEQRQNKWNEMSDEEKQKYYKNHTYKQVLS